MHTSNPHLARAGLLLQQRRYEQAEEHIRRSLGDDPGDPMAHAWLAICLGEREQHTEATREAQHAVALAPDSAYAHFVLARVLDGRNMTREALAAVNEAIRLDPEDAGHWALLAQLESGRKKHREALEAAERGLRIDPEHVACTNLRAIALSNLGRRDEASSSIRSALQRDPEDAATHANMGWTLLRQGEARKALEHFRESLRLDPQSEWARRGIVEAMKARFLLYRIFLGYFLFMARLPARAQWAIIIGGYIGYQLLAGAARRSPTFKPLVGPIVATYLVFAIGTCLAVPLFNLLLSMSRFGRLALLPAQRAAAAALGATMLIPAGFAAGWLWTGAAYFEMGAVLTVFMLLPVALTGQVGPGRARGVMLGLTAVLALACLAILLAPLWGMDAGMLVVPYMLGAVLSTWVSNAVNALPARVKR
jgi:tetratricopeptide (TPR) repeat protein